MRTFTLEEAQALLPTLESLLRRAIEARAQAEPLEQELQQQMRRIHLAGGAMVNVVEVARKKAVLRECISKIKDSVGEMDAIGVQVKDLNRGLLDFPAEIDGEIVLLCWELGEPRIGFWHSLEGGFGSRKPLDARFGQSDPETLN